MLSIKPDYRVIVISALLVLLSACSTSKRPADIDNPKLYSASGIKFKLPGNWRVDTDVDAHGLRHIAVTSELDAVAGVLEIPQRYSFSLEEKLALDMEEYTKTLASGVVSDSHFETIMLTTAVGDLNGIRQRFDVTIAGTSVPHTVDHYMLRYDDVTLYLSSRAPDEHLALAQAGFDQIFTTVTRYYF